MVDMIKPPAVSVKPILQALEPSLTFKLISKIKPSSLQALKPFPRKSRSCSGIRAVTLQVFIYPQSQTGKTPQAALHAWSDPREPMHRLHLQMLVGAVEQLGAFNGAATP
ncbi:hypothetical protein B0H14DRAFT_3489295 [Mycena olivaceomarginata]|nr:hypothetical protein B0H14DRAFT_3489295 [Mycena olivaceomarginata]